MIRRRRGSVAAAATLILPVLIAAPCHAYDPITWSSCDGGGVTRVTAGSYTLGGTIGQPDAGTLSGGSFTLGGGFWYGGQIVVSGVQDIAPPRIAFRFIPATPNPIRSESRLAFDLPAAAKAQLNIYDVAGRAVRTLDLGLLPAGHHEETWSVEDDEGRSLAGGVYFLRLEAGTERAAQKVLVIH